MKVFTVAVVMKIQLASKSVPARAWIKDAVMVPLAKAAPSVLTARPTQAPATMGSWYKTAWARKGKNNSSITAKITTRDETITGTTGRARMAAPVAIAADTPQIEIPDASGAAHSRLNRNTVRASR